MRLKATYSSREVAALTGLTARQLQLWDAGGLLSPTIPSHKTDAGGYTERRYTPIELFELLVLADLRRRGFTIRQLRQILRILQEQFGERLFDATGGGGAVQLLTDGKEIYARTASGAFFNLLRDASQPLLVIGNEGLLKDLSGKVRQGKKKKNLVNNDESTRISHGCGGRAAACPGEASRLPIRVHARVLVKRLRFPGRDGGLLEGRNSGGGTRPGEGARIRG